MKSTFGKYYKANLVHKLEKNPEISWELHNPTSEDQAVMERLDRQSPTHNEIFVLELAVTFEGTNLTEDNGDPYLVKEMPLALKKKKIGTMPEELVFELSKALGKYAEGWGILPVPEKEK